MANKIQIRRGLKSKLPTLSSGELAYTTDTRETFVGTGSGNVNMGGSHWYRGTAMSGTSTTTGYYSYSACPQVKVDDMYLNTSNGNVYACTTAGSGTTAKWTYQGSIKGVTGDKGEQGTSIEIWSGIDVDSGTYIIGAVSSVSSTTIEPYIGKIISILNASDFYDGIGVFNTTTKTQEVIWDLYKDEDGNRTSVNQGESAIIKFTSSNKAIVLIKS